MSGKPGRGHSGLWLSPSLADPFPHRYVLNVQLLIPGRPRDGNSAIAAQGFRPFRSKLSEEIPMAFVNEVVSDEDLAKYNLPFKPGAGRYWTRDRERDSYLWGGIVENFARDYVPEGRFWLFIQETCLDVSLSVRILSRGSQTCPARIVWEEITHIQPWRLNGVDEDEFLNVLKEALRVYGLDGEKVNLSLEAIVTFLF